VTCPYNKHKNNHTHNSQKSRSSARSKQSNEEKANERKSNAVILVRKNDYFISKYFALFTKNSLTSQNNTKNDYFISELCVPVHLKTINPQTQPHTQLSEITNRCQIQTIKRRKSK